MKEYQLVVIGAGPGGYVAAIRAAQSGMATALIEERDVGGTCLNRGCVPTKALLHSAGLYREIRSAGEFGITAKEPAVDLAGVYAAKDRAVEKLRSGVEQLIKANKIDLYRGKGSFKDSHTVQIEGQGGAETVSGERVLIATGSSPALPPIPGANLPGVVTSDGILEKIETLPGRVVIVGGGVIGVEFATFFLSLGVSVHIIEMMNRIAPLSDREISQSLAMSLKKKGAKISVSSKVLEFKEGGPLLCRYEEGGKECEEEADLVLLAAGRRPNTAGLGLDAIGLETDRGFIRVGADLQTAVPGVYACGDVTGQIQLAHFASAQGTAAIDAMLGREASVNLSVAPSCIYTDPEVASVGMTAEEAKAAGIKVRSAKFVMTSNAKSIIENAERGFIRVIASEETGKILGAVLVCQRATDLVSNFSQAIVGGVTIEKMASVIYPHPTFSEGILEAVEALEGKSVHSAPVKL